MNLEEAQSRILELEDEIKLLKEQSESQTVNIEELTARNHALQEHNQKLFLRVTTQSIPSTVSHKEDETILSFLETVKL